MGKFRRVAPFHLSQLFFSQPSSNACSGCSVTQLWQGLHNTAMLSSSSIDPPRPRVLISCKSVANAIQQRSQIGCWSNIFTRNLRRKFIFFAVTVSNLFCLCRYLQPVNNRRRFCGLAFGNRLGNYFCAVDNLGRRFRGSPDSPNLRRHTKFCLGVHISSSTTPNPPTFSS